jgi:hypothetical protein
VSAPRSSNVTENVKKKSPPCAGLTGIDHGRVSNDTSNIVSFAGRKDRRLAGEKLQAIGRAVGYLRQPFFERLVELVRATYPLGIN